MKELDWSITDSERTCSNCAMKNQCTFCEDHSLWTRPTVEKKAISRAKVAVSIAKLYQSAR